LKNANKKFQHTTENHAIATDVLDMGVSITLACLPGGFALTLSYDVIKECYEYANTDKQKRDVWKHVDNLLIGLVAGEIVGLIAGKIMSGEVQTYVTRTLQGEVGEEVAKKLGKEVCEEATEEAAEEAFAALWAEEATGTGISTLFDELVEAIGIKDVGGVQDAMGKGFDEMCDFVSHSKKMNWEAWKSKATMRRLDRATARTEYSMLLRDATSRGLTPTSMKLDTSPFSSSKWDVTFTNNEISKIRKYDDEAEVKNLQLSYRLKYWDFLKNAKDHCSASQIESMKLKHCPKGSYRNDIQRWFTRDPNGGTYVADLPTEENTIQFLETEIRKIGRVAYCWEENYTIFG